MSRARSARRLSSVVSSLFAVLVVAPSLATAGTPMPCTVPDNGSGTVDLPPPGCGYVSPSDLHMMIDGLPPGTTINIDARHQDFFQVTRFPGGSLGGEVEQFQSFLFMNMMGTGELTGYNRLLNVQLQTEVHTGPRTPGAPVQTFPNEMVVLQGQLPPGDPDFDLLRVTGGSAFGMPGPGQTTLTDLGGGSWAVDSFFDVAYRIDFIGRPGGPLGGMSGSTTGTIRMQAGVPQGCPPIPPGTDAFPSTAKLVVQPCDPGAPSGCVPLGPPLVLRASDAFGASTIVDREVHDDSLGIIPIELVQLDLRGSHPLTGPFQIGVHPASPSLGELHHVVQDPTTCELVSAESVFRVCARIQVGPEVWTNVPPGGPCDPLELRAHITGLPPVDDKYENPFVRPVLLVEETTGAPRAQVVYELHHAAPPFPPPGTDCFQTTMQAQLELFTPPIQTQLFAQGPTMVARHPSPLPNQVPIEIVQMNLQGNNPVIGPFQLQLRPPPPPSAGQAQSMQPPDAYPVDSFFDVFFEIQSAQGPVHNQQPTRVRAHTVVPPFQPGADNLPPRPGTIFQQPPTQSTDLFTPGGTPIGRIRDVQHTVGPPEDWSPPPPADDYCFDSWIRFRVRIYSTGCEEVLMIPGGFRIIRSGPTDLDGDGNEEMRSLMIKKLIAGGSQCIGDFVGRLRPGSLNQGGIRSLAPAEFFPADSFFDVSVDLETAGGTLSTPGSVPMTTTINNLPPDSGEIYFGPGVVIPLQDQNGVVIGEIRDIEHQIHQRVLPCPDDCLPRIRFRSKVQMDVSVEDGGAGTTHDVVRGSLNALRSSGGSSLGGPVCLQNDGGPLVGVAAPPPPGQGFVYLTRDNFEDYVGSYDTSSSSQTGDRDTLAAGVCPP